MVIGYSDGKRTYMKDITKWIDGILTGRMGLKVDMATLISDAIATAAIVIIGIGINWICQSIFRWASKHNLKLIASKWHPYLAKRKLGNRILMLIPGIVMYILPYIFYENGDNMIRILHRGDIIFILIVFIMIANSLLMAFLDAYSTTEKNRNHPLQGLIQGLQVLLYFVGGIIITAVLIDKSPTVLLTGLGASAAVLMLKFKDSIMGLVAGVQLSVNDMLRPGDWIEMPKYGADGNVVDVTLTTVKVQNWDKTIVTIPPYILVSDSFQNWRGMKESGGRRIKRSIYIDMNSIGICDSQQIRRLEEKRFVVNKEHAPVVNLTLFREWLEEWLSRHPRVNKNMTLMVRQLQPTSQGLPLELYFFFDGTDWIPYEHLQSEIFEYVLAILPEFGLKAFQSPSGCDFWGQGVIG